MRYYYFVTEGAHDAAAIGRVLRLEGFRHQHTASALDDIWRSLLPRQFPFVRDELDADAPIPFFYTKGDISVAVRMAGGIGKLLDTLDDDLYVIRRQHLRKLRAVGIFLDADDVPAAQARARLIAGVEGLNSRRMERGDDALCFEASLLRQGTGTVFGVPMRAGMYVFPDDAHQGTLEDLLLEASDTVFPRVRGVALHYVREASALIGKEHSQSHKKKATVGCIANICRPGKSNQISIYLDAWISRATQQQCAGVRNLTAFIRRLLKG
nr:DUF3226 domain-containing protein [Maliibacterium massiliense]